MVSTVNPKAKLTPRNPMPSDGKPAANTALPQPANVSQKVPKNSAPRRRCITMFPRGVVAFRSTRSGSLRSRLNTQRGLSVYRLPFEIDIWLGSKAPVYGSTRLCPSFRRAPHGSRQAPAVPTAPDLILIFRNAACGPTQISCMSPAVLSHSEGRLATSRTRGGMRWTRRRA
jgi:hypothetical protein